MSLESSIVTLEVHLIGFGEMIEMVVTLLVKVAMQMGTSLNDSVQVLISQDGNAKRYLALMTTCLRGFSSLSLLSGW